MCMFYTVVIHYGKMMCISMSQHFRKEYEHKRTRSSTGTSLKLPPFILFIDLTRPLKKIFNKI